MFKKVTHKKEMSFWLVILVELVIILGGFLIGGNIVPLYFTGEKVEGTITNVEFMECGRNSPRKCRTQYRNSFSFLDLNGVEIDVTEQKFNVGNNHEIGEKVKVLYEADNSKNAVIKDPGAVTLSLIMIFTGMILVTLTILRIFVKGIARW